MPNPSVKASPNSCACKPRAGPKCHHRPCAGLTRSAVGSALPRTLGAHGNTARDYNQAMSERRRYRLRRAGRNLANFQALEGALKALHSQPLAFRGNIKTLENQVQRATLATLRTVFSLASYANTLHDTLFQ